MWLWLCVTQLSFDIFSTHHILADQFSCVESQPDLSPYTDSVLYRSPELSGCVKTHPLQMHTCAHFYKLNTIQNLSKWKCCKIQKRDFIDIYHVLCLWLFPANMAPFFLQVTRGGGTPLTIHSSTAGLSTCTDTIWEPSLIVGATEGTCVYTERLFYFSFMINSCL